MPQRSAQASPSPLPRASRLPCFDTGFDARHDHEPSVIVLSDLDTGDDGPRITLDVLEEDIETGVFNRRGGAGIGVAAVAQAHAHEPAPPSPRLAQPRPRKVGMARDPYEATAPARMPPVPPLPCPAHAPAVATPEARPAVARRASGHGGVGLAVLLGALAFFGGWRVTGGDTWLANATLGPTVDHALALAKAGTIDTIATFASQLR